MATKEIHVVLLLKLLTTIITCSDTSIGGNVTRNSENYTNAESKEVFTLPTIRHVSEFGNSGDNETRSSDSGDWPVLEEYFKSLLNYSNLPDNDENKGFLMTLKNIWQREIIATQLSYCPLEELCSHSLNISMDAPFYIFYDSCCTPCSCNQNVSEFGLGCPDMLDLQDGAADRRKKTCIPLHLNTKIRGLEYSRAAYAIAHCPASSTYDGREKCVQDYNHTYIAMKDILPVMTNGTVYRNIHCSLCNGVNTSEPYYFKANLGCMQSIPEAIQTDSDLIQFVLSGKECDIGFSLDDFEPDLDLCLWGISKCNVTGLWEAYDPYYDEACQLYTSVIRMADDTLFNNVFCAFCNGYTTVQRKCKALSHDLAEPYSFTGLLTVADSNDQQSIAGDKQCSSDFIHHKNLGICIKVSCAPHSQLVEDTCVQFMNATEDYAVVEEEFFYNVILRLTPALTHSISEAWDMAEQVMEEVKWSIQRVLMESLPLICSADIMLKSNIHCDQLESQYIINQTLAHFLLNLNFSIISYSYSESITSILNAFLRIDMSYKNETTNISIVNGYKTDFSKGQLENNTSSEENPKVNAFCSRFGDRIIVPFFNQSSAIDNCFNGVQYITVTSLLECPMVQISQSTHPWTVNDDGVLFMESGHVFNHSQFYLSGHNESDLFLCKDQYFQLPSKTVTRRWALSVEHFISIACVSLSIVSLLVTLIVFFVLSKMRTLPGKNNMALVSALIIAQALYLISSFSGFEQGSVVCKLVGILTHFCWLLVAFWMNVCTFHMFRVLTKTKAMTRRSGNKRYASYHVYCIVASAVFVGINVLVSSVTSGYNDMGYGLTSCYISSPKMLLYTFGIPLALIIVSNLGMFVVVMVTIKKASAVRTNAKNARNDIAVFARLSTLTGATWIFGFIYTWSRLVVFSYIFIILNAGQGVFLFLSFVCTRRVMNMAGEKYSMSTFAASSTGTHNQT